jgi:hypothetical protein
MAKETVVQTLRELCDAKVLNSGGAFKYREVQGSPHVFHVQWGQTKNRILIMSGSEPKRLKGSNIGAAGIDEPFICEEAAFDQVIARLRHPEARHVELNLSGTPEQLNWGYDLAEGELGEQHDVGVVRASTSENLVLGDAYLQRLSASMDEKTYAAYVEGHFLDLGAGLVYYGFSRINHVIHNDVPPGAMWGVGMDFNVNPMAACVFWKWRDHLHFVEDIELPNSDTEEMCMYLRENYPQVRDVFPDASGAARSTNSPAGRSDFSIIKEFGFEIHTKKSRIKDYPENPRRRDRWNAVNGKFRPRDGNLTMTIEPGCKKLIKYLSIFSHENMTKQEEYSHLLDAFSYPIAFLFPIKKAHTKVTRVAGA